MGVRELGGGGSRASCSGRKAWEQQLTTSPAQIGLTKQITVFRKEFLLRGVCLRFAACPRRWLGKSRHELPSAHQGPIALRGPLPALGSVSSSAGGSRSPLAGHEGGDVVFEGRSLRPGSA